MNQIYEEIEQIAELLYQEKKDTAYTQITVLIPKLAQYIENIESEEVKGNLLVALQNALSAMEEEDLTLLADILQYDLLELLQEQE